MELTQFLIAALGAFVAGAVNALAGGGTLITFPLMLALGVPPISANITNSIVLIPGYFGGIFAQRADLMGQKPRLLRLLPAAAAGGLIGGSLLLLTGEKIFEQLVPFLVLLATLLIIVGEPLRKWLSERSSIATKRGETRAAFIPVMLAAVYGGYFGGVMSVIVIAILGLCFSESLTRLNALKHTIAFVANCAAALLFLFSGKIIWLLALIMGISALLGGATGGKLAGKVSAATLRWIVVSIGLTLSLIYFIRAF